MTPARRAPRGTTLIELMVAMAMFGVVLAVTMGVIVGSTQSKRCNHTYQAVSIHIAELRPCVVDVLPETPSNVTVALFFP